MRHGEVWNPGHVVYASLPGFELTEAGVAQARAVSRYLRSAPVVAVWSSPLERALATAEPVAAHHGIPIRVDPELVEWKMADDWAGIAWEDLPKERPGELEAYLEHPLDMPFASESLTALAARMRTVLASIASRHDGDVVVVSHQDPVQAARLSITGRDLANQHVDKPAHGTVITLKPGTPWTELTVWHPEQAQLAETSAAAATQASAHRPTQPSAEPGVDPEANSEQLGIGLEGERW
ncbi:MAG TPA: histidine phosphatase family protein [Acidimicrobiia bacterium]|nr:histidine phosphatase family protein [Acidimicrobiia bacterium]